MDYDVIRSKLKALGQRDWPDVWGAREDAEIGDFYSWGHRYRMEEPLSEAEVSAFEQQHAVDLPATYREFLIRLGNGGAGPDYGIYPLGEGEDESLPTEILGRISEPFALHEAWNDTTLLAKPEEYYGYELMAGALPIATKGCALDYWLVISGPRAGQIWLDKRTDNEGVEPVRNAKGGHITFGPWFEQWLDEAYAHHFGHD